jgi:hypothetical protein
LQPRHQRGDLGSRRRYLHAAKHEVAKDQGDARIEASAQDE